SHGEFTQVELSQQDGASLLQARDHRGVGMRYEVAIHTRAVGSQNAPGPELVLHRLWHPKQWPHITTPQHRLLGLAGCCQRLITHYRNIRVELLVEPLDACEVGLYYLHWGLLFRLNGDGRLRCREPGNIVSGHGYASSSGNTSTGWICARLSCVR